MVRLAVSAAGIVCVSLLGCVVSLAARPRAEILHFASGSEVVASYLALPSASGRHAAILIVHGDDGMTEWTKEKTRELATQGYIALAVDLYRGKVAADSEEAHELARGVPDDRALRDLEAAFAYLIARRDVSPAHIGVIGWQIGGWFALQLAIHEPRLAACVISNSALPTDPADLSRIHAPVLGHFGAKQRGINQDQIKAFEDALRTRGVQANLKTYPDAGSDFENGLDSIQYKPADAAAAWAQDLDFFARSLRE